MREKLSIKDRAAGIIKRDRVGTGREQYTTKELNLIAGGGVSTVILTNHDETIFDTAGMFSWQSVYESYRSAGLTHDASKEETDERVWILD